MCTFKNNLNVLFISSTIIALDNNNYYVLSSLDLSSAFDVLNRELLFERLKIFGIPEDVRQLIFRTQ